jgi:hypothetical protein
MEIRGRKPPFFIMGLFSKKKTVVSSTAMALFDVDPAPIQESVIRSIFRGERIGQSLISDAINGSSKLANYYHYGKHEYTRGLPVGTTEKIIFETDEIKEYIQSMESLVTKVTSVELELNEPEFFLKDYLVSEYGYNRITNHIEEIPADILLVMDTDSTNHLNLANEALQGHMAAQQAFVPVNRVVTTATTYQGRPANKEETIDVISDEIISTLPGFIKHVAYYGKEIDAGTGQSIDYTLSFEGTLKLHTKGKALVSYTEVTNTKYIFTDDLTESDSVVTTGELIETEGYTEEFIEVLHYPYTVSYNQVIDQINAYYYIEYYVVENKLVIPKHLLYSENDYGPTFPKSSKEDENPYYPVVMLRQNNEDLFAESEINTPDYISSKKLLNIYGIDVAELANNLNENPDIDQVDHIYLVSGVALNTEKESGLSYLINYFDYVSDVAVTPEIPRIVIERGRSVYNYQEHILHQGVTYGLNSVSIKEGGLDSSIYWTKIEKQLLQGRIGKIGFVKSKITIKDKMELITFSEQIDKNTYKEIKVYNLKHIDRIYKNYTVETNLKDLLNKPDEHTIVVPLHSVVVESLPSFTRNALFYGAPHLVFYSHDVIKLKWYQTGLFKAFMLIVAIVVLVYTGIDVYTVFAATLATEGAVAAAIYLATVVLQSIALSYVFKYSIKVLGQEFAFLVAILAFAASLMGDFSGVSTLMTSWAEELMLASAGLSKAISDDIAEDLKDLMDKMSVFQEDAKSLMDELEQKQELLAPSKLLNPMEFARVEPVINLNESPSDFYNRTIHNVNVGPLAFSAIEDFVDINLALPKVNHNF